MIPQFEPLIYKDYIEAVTKTMASGWVGSGEVVTRFEHAVAEFTGARHAITTSSGTASILIALYMFAPKVIAIPNYSFIAAINCARFLDMQIQLVDINPLTLCMDPYTLKKVIHKVDLVAFINHNGYVGDDLLKIRDLCRKEKKILIEDAACALGQRYDGIHAGNFAELGCFSFSVPKIVTTGQGGMIITNSDIIAYECRKIVDQGSTTWRKDGLHKGIGLNFKLSNIAASYGLAQIKRIDDLLDIRYKNQKRMLDRNLNLVTYVTDCPTGTWMNILRCSDAEEMMNYLNAKGIESKMYYKPTNIAIGNTDTNSVAYTIYKTKLYLPSSLTLTDNQIDYICETINDY